MLLTVDMNGGTVRVSFEDANGNTVEFDATAEEPLELETQVAVVDGEVTITFEGRGGTARDVVAIFEVGRGLE